MSHVAVWCPTSFVRKSKTLARPHAPLASHNLYLPKKEIHQKGGAHNKNQFQWNFSSHQIEKAKRTRRARKKQPEDCLEPSYYDSQTMKTKAIILAAPICCGVGEGVFVFMAPIQLLAYADSHRVVVIIGSAQWGLWMKCLLAWLLFIDQPPIPIVPRPHFNWYSHGLQVSRVTHFLDHAPKLQLGAGRIPQLN